MAAQKVEKPVRKPASAPAPPTKSKPVTKALSRSNVLFVPYYEPPWKIALGRARKRVRHFMCRLVNNGHELYSARTDTKLYQQCLLCGYETHGWTIDRRDRKLHLVAGNSRR